MRTSHSRVLYRHTGVALLRAAVWRADDGPDWWPNPADPAACRSWLDKVWSTPGFADAMEQASPTLSRRVQALRAGRAVDTKPLHSATLSTARYVLRATGRPTPFGLFAGVAPVVLAPDSRVHWGTAHRPVIRADTQWLAAIIDGLETCPELLERLDVVFTDLAVRRGAWLEAPHGPDRVRIRCTNAVEQVQVMARSPIAFGVVVDRLSETFGGAERSVVLDMLTELVRQGFLITCLRAPLTVTDPLTFLLDKLSIVGGDAVPSVAPKLRDLETVRALVHRHNHADAPNGERTQVRAAVARRMRAMSDAGRTPLAVDLLLDCDLRLSERIVADMERAASALLRLTRHPTGQPVWRDYLAAFRDQYGTDTLVPVTEVLNPDAGLGYPAGYPGSTLPVPVEAPSERDTRMLALAWQAVNDRSREVVLTDEGIRALTGDRLLEEHLIPPHVELAARIHATDREGLERGEYTLVVAPARAGGTLTSRFTATTLGSGLEEVYLALPGATAGALPVQMSFPPAYPHAENICRIPAYLPHVLSLGEHRTLRKHRAGVEDDATLGVDDLAVTASGDRLHLVSMSLRRVVEPLVFHALALDKQPPPLARFLAHLPRAFTAAWTVLDWGPYADQLPYLPRVRYERCVLTPARWRLTTDDLTNNDLACGDLPGGDALPGLDRWRDRWDCPATVGLRDDDRSLRLNLNQPLHAEILRSHLARHGHAILTESSALTGATAEFGWFDGHAHEIAVPLVTTRLAAPSPPTEALPVVTNARHGHPPGSPDASWLYAKLHTHPERQDDLIARHLPELLAGLGRAAECWFVRYRSQQEPDHLRLRLRIPAPDRFGPYAAVVGGWAQQLRRDGLAGRLVFDTYLPEVGRYGPGAATHAAECVFVADSTAVAAGLRHLPTSGIHRTALAAASIVDIACGFLGSNRAMAWLSDRPVPAATAVDRVVVGQALRLAQHDRFRPPSGWPDELGEAWRARRSALAIYRSQLSAHTDVDAVLESLLHMHHNRALGIDPDSERSCRKLARQSARSMLALQAQQARTGE